MAAVLVEVLLNGSADEAVIAAGAIPLRGSGAVEDRVRSGLRWGTRDVPRVAGSGVAIWTELLSPDGHRREAALQTLDQAAPCGFLLAVLLRRLNDWVVSVRLAARAAVRRCVARSDPVQVAEVALSLLVESRSWRRDGSGQQVIRGILAQADLQDAVLRRMCDASARPVTLAALMVGEAFDGILPSLATDAVVPGIRAGAVQALARGDIRTVVGWEKVWVDRRYNVFAWKPVLEVRRIVCAPASDAALRDFVRDPSAVVRRALLDGLRDRGAPETRDIAALLIDDPWPSIRERVAFLLRDQEASQAAINAAKRDR